MAVVRAKIQSPQPSNTGLGSLNQLVESLKSAGLYRVPVPIMDVAEYVGLEVVEEVMDDDISGYLELKGGRWVIGINRLHHRNRQRFTIAHEIAHYLLHRQLKTSFIDQTFARRENDRTKMEREADEFAAALLMPEEEVNSLIRGGDMSLESLANAFQVSTLAMRFRALKIGYGVK